LELSSHAAHDRAFEFDMQFTCACGTLFLVWAGIFKVTVIVTFYASHWLSQVFVDIDKVSRYSNMIPKDVICCLCCLVTLVQSAVALLLGECTAEF
jgi:hypothetical protein